MPNRRTKTAGSRAAIGLFHGGTLLAALVFLGCGYHVAGHAARLPSDWKTIAVPTFQNHTPHYRIEQRFTAAVVREFLARTKYRIVQDTGSADGVLQGDVLTIEATPLLFNATTGQVTTMLVTVHAKIALRDNCTEQAVYENADMVFRQEYQISTDVNSFFEQQDPALERMSRDLASKIVSNVLENF